MHTRETKSFSFLVQPITLKNNCTTYYIQDKAHLYNCTSNNTLATFPPSVPNHTDWQDLSNNKITKLCADESYIKGLSSLRIINNSVEEICDSTIEAMSTKLTWLRLDSNQLKTVPKIVKKLSSLVGIWLGNNPYVCECDMLWLNKWVQNESDFKIVKDKIWCPNFNKYLQDLDEIQMGCVSLTTLQKIMIGLTTSITLVVVVALIAISRRWNEVKFFMYLHFDILWSDDSDGILEGKEFDAFVSYR